MKRTPLSIGSTIQAKGGSSYTYIIDRVIGDGASSIVYEAHYIDGAYGRHDVRLKECYPYTSDIQRIGTELVWADAATATSDKIAFTTAYHKLLDFQNTTKLRNSTAHIFDLCEANGTLYSVMDVNEGQTFEQDNSEKLSDILKTTLALARVVEKYHNNGYLHLDIKPSNFLVIPETRELVILFDIDSVMSMEDIASGKVKCVSYSKGWAAPEQMQGRIDKLCPATDIFSIGAILFQKVMGRDVENEDIGIFADWEFDSILFENTNPKIKRLLRNIFRKTLAANTKRRYQSVDDLISTLEAAVECVRDGAPYLISDCPNPNKNFLGREKELANIATAFNNGKKTVFLHGFGGIGKSELAKKYAQLHEKEYDSVLFLSYENSLEELLDDIQIQNCETEAKNDNIKILKKIFADQRVLLIVDNFDVEIDSDDYLDTFLRLKVDKLFTTRTDFSDIADDKTQQINVENLNAKELASLFEKESGLLFSNEDRVVIDEIFKNFDYYTLIVPILAKQLVSSGWSLETLREKSKQGLRAFEDTEKVAVAKDGRIYRKTGLDMMRATFRIVGLTEIQRRVLINLYFLRFVKINKEEYRKYMLYDNEKRVKHIDAINELLYLGWIKRKNTWRNTSDAELDIHPIIVEMIEIELQPDITKSNELTSYIERFLPWHELSEELMDNDNVDILCYEINKEIISNKLKWFAAFVSRIDLSNNKNFIFCIEKFYTLINGNVFIIDLFESEYFSVCLDNIKKHINLNIYIDKEISFKAANILEVSILHKYVIDYRNNTNMISVNDIKEFFYNAEKYLDKINDKNKSHYIWHLCKPVIQIIAEYQCYVPDDIYNCVKSHHIICKQMCSNANYFQYNILDTFRTTKKQVKDQVENIDLHKLNIFASKDNLSVYEFNYIDKYFEDSDVFIFNNELLSDNKISNMKKNYIYCRIADGVFLEHRLFLSSTDLTKFNVHKVDFNKVKILLDFQKEFYDNTNDLKNVRNAKEFNDRCNAYRATIFALNYDITGFQYYANLLMDTFIIDLLNQEKDDYMEEFWNFKDIFIMSRKFGAVYLLFDMLRVINKKHLAIPYLILCANYIHERLKNLPEYSELMMYSWYKTIADFSLGADDDCVHIEYQNKIDKISEKDYEFNKDILDN